MISNKKYNNRGYTLVEFILYMGLFSIMLFITLEMFSSIFEIQLESEATSSVSEDGKHITQRFTYDVNRATGVTTPATYGASSSTLAMIINGESVIYGLDSGNLTIENQTAGTIDQINSFGTTVSDLSFVMLDGGGADSIQMSFTLTSEVIRKGGAEVKSIQTTAGLR